MKKIISILAGLLLITVINAQKIYYDFDLDTVQGNETIYFTPGNAIIGSSGTVGFFFKATNVSGTVDYVTLQGSYDGTNYVNIDTIAAAATGTYFIYDKIKTSLTYSVTTADTITVTTADTITLAFTDTLSVLDTLQMTILDSCGTSHDTSTVFANGSSSRIAGNSGTSINGASGTSVTSATGTYTINSSSKVVNYMYYRLACDGGSADTCIYDPVTFIYKE